ncbi:MAG: glucokinase [Spirochaetales bacterium]
MILAGDIGGTNTTLALVSEDGGMFAVRARRRFATRGLANIEEALTTFQEEQNELWSGLSECCLSAAGPVTNNRCSMTNVSSIIDGHAIAKKLGVPTRLINDFSAICYALPLIETRDGIDAIELEHPDGSKPKPSGTVHAVVGAGTGLGTGYLIEDRGHYAAHASEAGHTDFATPDELSAEFGAYMANRYPIRPGVEPYVSGQGIRNAFHFFVESGRLERDKTVREILSLEHSEVPEAVSEAAAKHEGMAEIMRFFVKLYARFARNTALYFLPSAGLYIAGGIAAKNQEWFLEGHAFMREFEQNYNDRITPLLRSTPVFLIQDYDISLYGAAHAAICLR